MTGSRDDRASAVVVREARSDDTPFAQAASNLIELVSADHDIATRTPEWLDAKIVKGRAALALEDGELIGFGYWSDWEGGTFVSHSGLVVRPDRMGLGLDRRLKMVLFESSRAELPNATMMSLTNSPQVKALNESLGFRVVPLDQLTKDPAFWVGCETCRNFADVRARGEKCCCEGLIRPGDGGGDGGSGGGGR